MRTATIGVDRETAPLPVGRVPPAVEGHGDLLLDDGVVHVVQVNQADASTALGLFGAEVCKPAVVGANAR